MRFARGDMRDHIVSHKNDHGASYERYGVLQWWSRLKISFCEILGVVQFSTFTVDVVGLVAWLHRDALIKRLDAEIDTESDDPASLSHEARQKAEAEILGDVLEQDRIETEMVFAAQSQGLPVEHRGDCAPQAILGVKLITAPRAAPPASLPERASFDLAGGRR